MRVVYICDICGCTMAALDLPAVSQAALGLHALTPEEEADIISYDAMRERMVVKSLCDGCVRPDRPAVPEGMVH